MNAFIKDKKQLSIFTTAGYPEINSLQHQISLLTEKGVDFIEVGIPFSDPLADGPIIQQTSSIALRNGMQMDVLFEQLKRIETKIPIVLMGYLNPVLRYGLDRFLNACSKVKIASVILPDLSIEIYERDYQKKFELYGIYPSFLITPATTEDRVEKIAALCENSFVYLVSGNATTGGKNKLKDNMEDYRRLKKICGRTPLFIGFGIKTKEDVSHVHTVADGAIIGSAFLKAVENRSEEQFIESLL